MSGFFSRAKMDSAWTDRKVRCLIDIWADEEIQALLESARRNKHVFERIAKEMSKAGYNKTAEQCRDKIKKLKIKYRKIKDVQQTSGAGRQDWPFFDDMDAVLGTRHATEPPITIDTTTVQKDDTPDKPEVDGKEEETRRDQSVDKPSHRTLHPRRRKQRTRVH